MDLAKSIEILGRLDPVTATMLILGLSTVAIVWGYLRGNYRQTRLQTDFARSYMEQITKLQIESNKSIAQVAMRQMESLKSIENATIEAMRSREEIAKEVIKSQTETAKSFMENYRRNSSA